MAELSERSGVPVPTIKYYLRQRLLEPGEALGATRAVYGERHVQRLRLVRALVEIAGMGLERVREVLVAVDDETAPLMESIGAAHMQLSASPATPPSTEARERVAALVRRSRWRTDPDESHGTALAVALDAAAAAGQPIADATLDTYAAAAAEVAKVDLASTPKQGATGATTYAVLGTLLNEPVLISLRRMAHENLARRRISRAR